MERKSKVTQATVNAACEQLQADSKNVTVNAVISITGGSFSTVGAMVKAWKEEQAAHIAPLMQMPESVTNAMHKAAFDIWAAASTLAGESVERIQHEAGEAITKAKVELSEYAGEVSRLERELEQANIKALEMQKNLDAAQEKAVKITAENAGYVAQLTEKDHQLISLKADYAKLQGELVEIAKAATKPAPKRTTKTPPKKAAE
ncbi:hypothetical protein BMR07_15770 [Methylococcaceae bacterium CS1]|nr:hypothetical protein BMR10_09330 [Methylococcaceae bacterium CS4]TXK96600.1 hypothetical protein BMR11_11580 [Methylococcaceae bacterium CS5]TXL03244.1 hypothetical protein BMR07_15770 [Methylococcaceae bacterium CS1]TXL03351.1 hypothetical protein BMR09_15110 [Methylococcaceae bacterium CS3]TXL05958.1 hypothetical protein BMR08_15750 [Methylococcaceae bacterium CS2]